MPVRTATDTDAPDLVVLVNAAYRGESSRAGWTTEADLLAGQRVDVEGMKELIAKPRSVILTREQDRGLVACVHLEMTGDECCYLGLLTIAPTAQGAGLGRQMLDAAEHWATEQWQAQTMEMTVIVQRAELIAWYERRGYRRTGVRKPFPYGDERFGLPQRDDLVFEVLRKTLTV